MKSENQVEMKSDDEETSGEEWSMVSSISIPSNESEKKMFDCVQSKRLNAKVSFSCNHSITTQFSK